MINAKKMGIIKVMVLAMEACLGSAFLLAMLILLSTYVDNPTKTGMISGLGSGLPRLSQRKLSLTGIAESTNGNAEYNFGPRQPVLQE